MARKPKRQPAYDPSNEPDRLSEDRPRIPFESIAIAGAVVSIHGSDGVYFVDTFRGNVLLDSQLLDGAGEARAAYGTAVAALRPAPESLDSETGVA